MENLHFRKILQKSVLYVATKTWCNRRFAAESPPKDLFLGSLSDPGALVCASAGREGLQQDKVHEGRAGMLGAILPNWRKSSTGFFIPMVCIAFVPHVVHSFI